MSPALQVALSGTLTFGVPLALAIREMLKLRRGGRRGRGDDPGERDPFPLPTGGAPSVRKLPACLVPVTAADRVPRQPTRTRELEPV